MEKKLNRKQKTVSKPRQKQKLKVKKMLQLGRSFGASCCSLPSIVASLDKKFQYANADKVVADAP